MSYDFYIGAFAVCKPSLKDITIEHSGCKKCNRNLPKYQTENVNFCPKCGTEITITETITKKVNIQSTYDAFENMGEVLYSPDGICPSNLHYYLPNINSKAKLSNFDEECSWVEIHQEIIDVCSTAFLYDFKNELDFLKNYYGEDKVEVRFGVVMYWV